MLFQAMANRQNYDPNAALYHCGSLILAAGVELEEEEGGRCGRGECEPAARGMLFDRLDLLAVDSLCTISRGSLDIAADPPQMDVNTNIEEEPPSTLPSHDSLIFDDQLHPNSTQHEERALVAKTQELSLACAGEGVGEEGEGERLEMFSACSPLQHRRLQRGERRPHLIRQPRQLIRELRREHKYSERIMADVGIVAGGRARRARGARIMPIVSEKGHLSGLIVENAGEELKIRVVNQRTERFLPKLELWEEEQEEWVDFTFTVRIRSL